MTDVIARAIQLAKEATNGWACVATRNFEHDEIARLHREIDALAGRPEVAPIPLNDAQEQAAKDWAADDRLWTTQDTVEINLRTFARVILKAAGQQAPADSTDLVELPGDKERAEMRGLRAPAGTKEQP